MKSLLLLPIIMILIIQNTEYKLNGKYVVTSNQYQKSYTICFNDSVFKKVLENGEVINGVIEYSDNQAFLIDYETEIKFIDVDLRMIQTNKVKKDELISLRNIKNDTINFCYHQKSKDGPINWLDVCHFSSQFIKVK